MTTANFELNSLNDKETIPVLLTLEELWYLRSVIKSDMPNIEQWRIAPVSLKLNSDIIEALYFCETSKNKETPVLLTLKDTFIIDYVTDAAAKNASGVLIGKAILLKIYKARLDLAYNNIEAEEPSSPTIAEIKEKINELKDGLT